MSTFEDVNKIIFCEKNFNIVKYKFKGIELWPLVRENFLNEFIHNIKGSSPKKKKNKKTLKIILIHIIIIFKNTINYKIKSSKWKLKKCDLFFLSSYNHYFDLISGKDYNRFIDPYIEILKDRYSCSKYVVSDYEKKINPLIPCLHISNKLIKEIKFSFFFLFSNSLIDKQIDLIKSELDIKINERYFKRKLFEIIANYELFKKLLRKTTPKLVFLIPYYSTECFGLTLAAKELEIKVVEIQHGKNGKYNYMKSHLHQFPKNGFKLLPDFFFTWGDGFSKELSKYFPKEFTKHSTYPVGNPWMTKCAEEDFIKANKKRLNFLEEKNYMKLVLFSLQALEYDMVFPDWLVEIIEQNKNIFWLLRTHPTQTYNSVNWKDCDKLSNVNILEASSVPLFYILNKIDINITLWSSVCIDALEFGVKSVIIHEEGKKIYEDQINKGLFEYCNNKNELIELLLYTKKNKIKKSKNIITDKSKIKKSIFDFVDSI